jgi:hypothetical protein
MTPFLGVYTEHLENTGYFLSPVSEKMRHHTSNKIAPQLSQIIFVVNLPVLVTTLIFFSSFFERHPLQYISIYLLMFDAWLQGYIQLCDVKHEGVIY